MNREILMLAESFVDVGVPPTQFRSVSDFYVSEKLDGIRGFWDGGISVGTDALLWPWYTGATEREATGLWSRYGKVIDCPRSWSSRLPPFCLDGELYGGRGQFQSTSSIVRTYKANCRPDQWEKIALVAFDSPPPDIFLQTGRVNNNVVKEFNFDATKARKAGLLQNFKNCLGRGCTFYEVVKYCRSPAARELECPTFRFHEQLEIQAWERFDALLASIKTTGGEGLMLRDKASTWEPKRSTMLLKAKPVEEVEGIVVSTKPGKGKHRGVIGSLGVRVTLNGVEQIASAGGLTDADRKEDWIGRVVTIKYRELTDDGMPKEARLKK